MTLRSIAMPTMPVSDEGKRQRDQQRVVEEPWRRIADDLLHDEGHIGADHHHLAMRHVDDAHDPEGDGKPDRGEKQGPSRGSDRKRHSAARPTRRGCFRAKQGPPARLAQRGPRRSQWQRAVRRRPGLPLVLTISMAAIRSSSEAVEVRMRAAMACSIASFTAGSVSLPSASRNGSIAAWSRLRNISSAALRRVGGIGCEQREAADDRLDLPSDLVVDGDLVEFVFGGLAERFAGRCIADLDLTSAVTDHDAAVRFSDQKLAVAERCQGRRRRADRHSRRSRQSPSLLRETCLCRGL